MRPSLVHLVLMVTLTVVPTKPSNLYAQDFHDLFKNAVFKKQVPLGVPGSICLVSTENNQPIAVMWRWWGSSTRLNLSPQQVKEILGRDIDLTDVKVLDQKGNLISIDAQNGLVINLGTEARYLVVSKDYHPPLAFPDDLSNVKVYIKSQPEQPLIVFDNLTRQVTIQIFDISGQLIKEIKNPDNPKWLWDGTDMAGKKVPPADYSYKIFGKGEAVVGRIIVK